MAQHPGRIKHIEKRRAQGMTHKELGEEFNMSRQHVGRLLRSKAEECNEKE